MPLTMRCEHCGSWVFVKAINDERKGYRLYYDCAKCGTADKEEWIDKRTW